MARKAKPLDPQALHERIRDAEQASRAAESLANALGDRQIPDGAVERSKEKGDQLKKLMELSAVVDRAGTPPPLAGEIDSDESDEEEPTKEEPVKEKAAEKARK
ncbi:hypothetical protein [Bradyrhizobium sp. Leo121]|uniref:hypothetical protein n=1 Tax=Bradyrhizobium sp. Leo121 TaxID=1571195 RepID=UPI001029F407|nr:hypothetical protein [Bradyrhizobium sp. Leo121]RZN24781.1 hypothetical protein CWO90_28495 [Bradyrhizobium sp. Leo121]